VQSYSFTHILNQVIFTLTIDQSFAYIIPTLLDQTILPGQNLRWTLESDTLFINPNTGFLKLSLVSNTTIPASISLALKPTVVTNYQAGPLYAFNTLAQSGNVLFLGSPNHPIVVLDVSDPLYPVPLPAYPSAVDDMAVNGGLLYLAAGDGGFQILNASNPYHSMPLLGAYPGVIAIRVVLQGKMALVIDEGKNQVLLMNVSNPTKPALLFALLNMGKNVSNEIAIANNLLYLANGLGGLWVVDVSNQTAPFYLAHYQDPGAKNTNHVALLSTDTALITTDTTGVIMLDVTNPNNLQFVARYFPYPNFQATSVLVANNIVLVSSLYDLFIFDVSDRSFALLGNFQHLDYIWKMMIANSWAFLANDISGLRILDLKTWQLTASYANTSEAGNYPLKVQATDQYGLTAQSTPFTLRYQGVPVVNGVVLPQLAKVDQPYNYFLPPDLITHPNLDAMSFSAFLWNDTLPSWLKFNAYSVALVGTPPVAGNFTIVINANDHVIGSVNVSFVLWVTYPPQLALTIEPYESEVEKPLFYPLPKNAFVSLSQLLLSYSARLSNGLSLPDWLNFDAETLIFSGLPNANNTGLFEVKIIATDPQQAAASTFFAITISPHYPPLILNFISDLTATAGEKFYFAIPKKTFIDPNNNPLNYSMGLVGNNLLPAWLQFDVVSMTLFGIPGHGDTDTFTARTLELNFTANNGLLSNSLLFRINVGGSSYGFIVFKVLGPLLTALSTILAAYSKRAFCLNCRVKEQKQAYQYVIGSDHRKVFKLKTPSDELGAVQIKKKVSQKRHCCSFWSNPYKELPAGKLLPHWAVYNESINALVVNGGPITKDIGTYRVEETNKAGVIKNLFRLEVSEIGVEAEAVMGQQFDTNRGEYQELLDVVTDKQVIYSR
jgi:hypothetical protein